MLNIVRYAFTLIFLLPILGPAAQVGPHQIPQGSARLFLPVVRNSNQQSIEAEAVLLAVGDIGNCDSPWDEAVAEVAARQPGAIALLGDTAYELGSQADIANCFDPAWGEMKVRIHPVPGNHDYYTSGASPYFTYFGSAAGSPEKGYYSYDLGSWHILALNSNCSEIRGCGSGSKEVEWMKADLASHPAECTLAYWHHPLFSSGEHGGADNMKTVWQVLYNAGVDIVLNGHEHSYERFAFQDPDGKLDETHGILEVVVGTGGGVPRAFPSHPAANSRTRIANTYGLLKLSLHASSFDWKYLAADGSSGQDSGSGACR